jgi:hypothetical protein
MLEAERRRRLIKLIAWGSPLVVLSMPESGLGGIGGFAELLRFTEMERLDQTACGRSPDISVPGQQPTLRLLATYALPPIRTDRIRRKTDALYGCATVTNLDSPGE